MQFLWKSNISSTNFGRNLNYRDVRADSAAKCKFTRYHSTFLISNHWLVDRFGVPKNGSESSNFLYSHIAHSQPSLQRMQGLVAILYGPVCLHNPDDCNSWSNSTHTEDNKVLATIYTTGYWLKRESVKIFHVAIEFFGNLQKAFQVSWLPVQSLQQWKPKITWPKTLWISLAPSNNGEYKDGKANGGFRRARWPKFVFSSLYSPRIEVRSLMNCVLALLSLYICSAKLEVDDTPQNNLSVWSPVMPWIAWDLAQK